MSFRFGGFPFGGMGGGGFDDHMSLINFNR